MESKIYFWNHMGFQICIAFLIPLAIAVYGVFSNYSDFQDYEKTKQRINSNWNYVSVYQEKYRSNLKIVNIYFTQFATYPDYDKAVSVQMYLKAFKEDLQKAEEYANEISSDSSQKYYSSIYVLLKKSAKEVEEALAAAAKEDREQFRASFQKISANLVNIQANLKQIDRSFAKSKNSIFQEIESFKKELQAKRMVFAVAFFVTSIFFLFYLLFQIFKPIKSLNASLESFSNNKIDFSLRLNSNDRGLIAQISYWMNSFLEKMELILSSFSKANRSIKESTNKMQSYTKFSNDISTNMSKNLMNQSNELEMCSHSLVQMDGLLNSSSESTRQAATLSKMTMDRAKKGGNAVQETIDAIAKIEESSKKIEDLVGTVNEIASQTNLLAINAAIEASKAGEHGKGFAIVAEEVRKLADHSHKLLKEVNAQIAETSERVVVGVSLTKAAGIALDGIILDVESVSSLIQRIAVSSDMQTKKSASILESMQDVTKNIHQQASSMEKVSKYARNSKNELDNLEYLVNRIVNSKEQYEEVIEGIGEFNDDSLATDFNEESTDTISNLGSSAISSIPNSASFSDDSMLQDDIETKTDLVANEIEEDNLLPKPKSLTQKNPVEVNFPSDPSPNGSKRLEDEKDSLGAVDTKLEAIQAALIDSVETEDESINNKVADLLHSDSAVCDRIPPPPPMPDCDDPDELLDVHSEVDLAEKKEEINPAQEYITPFPLDANTLMEAAADELEKEVDKEEVA